MEKKPISIKIFDLVCNIHPKINKSIFKLWYQYISNLDKEAHMTFMNYGYADSNKKTKKIKLRNEDEKDRYCIQLYHHLSKYITLKDKNILEVGCGRGGGSSYIMRYLKPRSVVGVDFSKGAIDFCNKHYTIKGLSFFQADAEALPFKNDAFDVVFNVESSHCYPNMGRFLNEVYRLLRPNGYLLFADFRRKDKLKTLKKLLVQFRLKLIKEKNITPNVLKALDLDNERKKMLIMECVPNMLSKTFLYFAGMKGTEVYRAFNTGNLDYHSFTLQK